MKLGKKKTFHQTLYNTCFTSYQRIHNAFELRNCTKGLILLAAGIAHVEHACSFS